MIIQMKTTSHLFLSALLGTVAASCATAGAQPDDMSAQAHRREAMKHQHEAEQHEAEYDPSASKLSDVGGAGAGLALSELDEDHRAAAEALEKFEAQQCRGFTPEVRAACPLLGPVLRAEPIEGGVRLELEPEVDTDRLVDHVRCHFAFGRTRAHAGMPHCPLYLEDVRVERAGPSAIELTTPNAGDVDELRRRALEHAARE